jgi:phenylalanyl-tRNA synthetase alpha chain
MKHQSSITNHQMLSERVKEIYQEIEKFEVAGKEQLEQYRQRFVGRKGVVEALFEGLNAAP